MFYTAQQTLVFIILIGYVFSIAIYVLYIWLYERQDLLLKKYILSRILLGITWFIFYAFENNLGPKLESLANLFMYSGASLELYCMMSVNPKDLKKLKTSLILLTVISIITYTAVSKNILLRVQTTTVFFTTLYTIFFVSTLRKRDSKMLQVAGWLAVLFALANIFRGAYSLVLGVKLPLYSNVPAQAFLGLVWIIIAYSFPLLFLFVLKEKDNIKLQELITTKDKFFRIIGHDLKNPISQMIQLSGLLEGRYKTLSEEKIIMLFREMKESSIRGFRLLENLLEWARSQTGSISFTLELFSISELISENIKLFEKQAEMKNIKINNTGVHTIDITADRNMINTVVRNLLSNAIKFTYPNGEIALRTYTDKDHLIVSVKDDGVGMACEDCSKLFRIDSKFTSIGTNSEKGTGIGLILCKEFIDTHKGSIWVNSKLGEGSEFSFSIPVRR